MPRPPDVEPDYLYNLALLGKKAEKNKGKQHLSLSLSLSLPPPYHSIDEPCLPQLLLNKIALLGSETMAWEAKQPAGTDNIKPNGLDFEMEQGLSPLSLCQGLWLAMHLSLSLSFSLTKY